MYNLFFTSKNATNKGKFDIDFPSQGGLWFNQGTKIAVANLNVWNSIYNISTFRNNNVLYFKFATALNITGIDNIEKIHDNGTNIWVYKITLANGMYSANELDKYVAKLIGDWDTATDDLKSFSNRKLKISANTTFSKFDIYLATGTDMLFAENSITSKNIAFLLGFDMSIDGTGADKVTYNSISYWSTTTYRTNKNNNGNLGFQIAKIQNGRTAIHLHIRNNIIFGGYDSSGSTSDTVFAFDFTEAVGYLQTFNVNNLTWLDVVATNRNINQLTFEFTDQDNEPIGENLYENCSFVLVVKTPDTPEPN